MDWAPLPDGPASTTLLAGYAAAAAASSPHAATTRVRVVTVPGAVHAAFKDLWRHASRPFKYPPLLEYQGKNVGVRRARGRFILTTNPDDVLSASLVGAFAQMRLLDVNFYRAARGREDVEDGSRRRRQRRGRRRRVASSTPRRHDATMAAPR